MQDESGEFDLDKLKISLLLFGQNPAVLNQSAKFLTKRGWATNFVDQVNDVIRSVIDQPPDLVLLSASHPHPAAQKLPQMILQNFNIPTVSFLETIDTKSMANQQESRCQYKLQGVASGPNLHRGLRKILDELYNPNHEQENTKSTSSRAQTDQSKERIRVEGSTSNAPISIKGSTESKTAPNYEQHQNQNSREENSLHFSQKSEEITSRNFTEGPEQKGQEAIYQRLGEVATENAINLRSSSAEENSHQFGSNTQRPDLAKLLSELELSNESSHGMQSVNNKTSAEQLNDNISNLPAHTDTEIQLTSNPGTILESNEQIGSSEGSLSKINVESSASKNSEGHQPQTELSLSAPQETSTSTQLSPNPSVETRLLNPVQQQLETHLRSLIISPNGQSQLIEKTEITEIFCIEIKNKDQTGVCLSLIHWGLMDWSNLTPTEDLIFLNERSSIKNIRLGRELFEAFSMAHATHLFFEKSRQLPLLALFFEKNLPAYLGQDGALLSFNLKELEGVSPLTLPFHIHLEKNQKLLKYVDVGGALSKKQFEKLIKTQVTTYITKAYLFQLLVHQIEALLLKMSLKTPNSEVA